MFLGAKVEPEPELSIFLLCKYMRWSYRDYEEAPVWMIETAAIYMAEEARASKKK